MSCPLGKKLDADQMVKAILGLGGEERGRPAGLTRGRKEVGQVAKEEELDRQGNDTDTSLDSDDDTMVTWEEEELE